MPITDVIYDQGATATATGGAVLNVKAYGAKGDGTTDDTAAIKAAVAQARLLKLGTDANTAGSGRGSVVFFPHGLYRIKDTIHLPSGVSIRGAGMRTSQLQFALTPTMDGLVWDQDPDTQTGFLATAVLEDIDIKTPNRDSTTATARDLVVIHSAYGFAMNRVRIYGAREHNLRLMDCVGFSAFHLENHSAGISNLYAGAQVQGGLTTCRFVSCYFQNTQSGPCADVAGTGLTFDGCVFEDSGAATPAQGYGVRVRWGTAVFVGPYFEKNPMFDLIAGTEASTNTAERAQGTAVTVIDPTLVMYTKQTGGGGLKFLRGTATVLGGDFAQSNRPLVFSNEMTHVHVAINNYQLAPPEVDGGTLDQLPGLVLYRSPLNGKMLQTGKAAFQIGGGTPVSKHMSKLRAWTPNAGNPIANGAAIREEFNVADVDFGDTVVVGMKHGSYGLGGGVMLYGSVSAPGKVAVTLLNVYGSALTFGASTLRIDVWKHWSDPALEA